MFFEFIWFVLMFDFSFSEYTKIPRANLYFDEGKRNYIERQSEPISRLSRRFICKQPGRDGIIPSSIVWDSVAVNGEKYVREARMVHSEWESNYQTLDGLRDFCIAECGSQGYNAWRIYSDKPIHEKVKKNLCLALKIQKYYLLHYFL